MTAGQNSSQAAAASGSVQRLAFELFFVGFLVLFLELTCIRWFAAYVIFLQFFTNLTLIACFLGMSCGCLAARSSRDWLALYPLLMLVTVIAAFAIYFLFQLWGGLAFETGHQASPQEIMFGTETRDPDVAQFVVPIEFVAALFFVLIALTFVGLGQVLGRAFDAYPNRIWGYSLNIGGSLAGILGFSALSLLQAPLFLWFAVVAIGIAYFMRQAGTLNVMRVIALALVPLLIVAPGMLASRVNVDLRWSPYYAVYHLKDKGRILVNSVAHQIMVAFDSGGPAYHTGRQTDSPTQQQNAIYSLIHLLRADTGGAPFRDVLVIGAGSGNDLAHALHFGVQHIDAVEIDPVIQDIGIRYHPDRPYEDPRVVAILDDGRHFLRTTERKYDLVVYAKVDSLILHSGYANIWLESYLFSREAFEDIKRVLKPDGVFVTYNHFRQGWVVERVAKMIQSAFGCKPMVLTLPYVAELHSTDQADFTTMVMATCDTHIADAFAQHQQFWLNDIPSKNLGIDGFGSEAATMAAAEPGQWARIAPARLVHDMASAPEATDDWPFLYLRDRMIPDLNLRSVLLMGAIGLVMVYLFLPRRGTESKAIYIDGRMFFLGAAFMLLETKAVVQLALLFGSTWLVNSLVFAAVLILILLANLYVLAARNVRLGRCYAGLIILLAAAAAVPADLFIAGGLVWRYCVPTALALGPMFFAGAIFAWSFRQSRDPDQSFGSNIAGAVVGGFCEIVFDAARISLSDAFGGGIYLLSTVVPPIRLRRA